MLQSDSLVVSFLVVSLRYYIFLALFSYSNDLCKRHHLYTAHQPTNPRKTPSDAIVEMNGASARLQFISPRNTISYYTLILPSVVSPTREPTSKAHRPGNAHPQSPALSPSP